MRILTFFMTGAFLLGTLILSIAWVSEPPVDTVATQSVRVSSVQPKRKSQSTAVGGGGRYSSGGGYSSGK